ncbi:hypothetical protein [uncultured Lutibacter sp.]|uniref:hypothetical protein n=1 Tax=uncultured Lutibacter sp. TaxID=437739 RepID=UPI002617D0AB|nr:hypothetical protein [uncultured Lutibacter sp.]
MKKLITLIITISLFSCSDGDFDVPSFEFTTDVESCGEYVIYKKNDTSTEVIILTLTPTNIGTTEGDKTVAISTTLSVVYRIFEDGIGTNYFCQSIPPSTPKILKELIAESGTINIATAKVITNEVVTGYTYTITISDLLFNDADERILFQSFDFGILTVNL